MASIQYILGDVATLRQLFPPAGYADSGLGLKKFSDVIAHYTAQSLVADGAAGSTVEVSEVGSQYRVTIESNIAEHFLKLFAARHTEIFSDARAAKAIVGRDLLKEMNLWNPMEGYPVNDSPDDGLCKWHLCPPIGLNVMGQKGILCMHYPPWQAIQQGDFINCMTMDRWSTVLQAVGVPADEIGFYRTVIDVNPIAAPGSGQSEYPNDYFPIMMASGFFDGPADRDYIRSMLELYLEPPEVSLGKYTLPMIVCGSPLYDPQAPGWFRAAYKDQLPTNENGEVTVDVLQAGEVRLRPDSERATPYMIANHMIAAGVTGQCTDNPAEIPNIRKYEAQDLVAATFLYLCASNPDLSPEEARAEACQRYFGNDDGSGEPKPSKPEYAKAICALAQMDLFFCSEPLPHPKYKWEKALKRCEEAGNGYDPCAAPIGPCSCGD